MSDGEPHQISLHIGLPARREVVFSPSSGKRGTDGVTQATIVALYGDKPEPLRSFLAACQAEAAAVVGPRFRPYTITQIHGTLIGLERQQSTGGPVNRNFLRLRQREIGMDFVGVLRLVRAAVPFQVRIGGFAEADEPFLSRGARPYARGFSVHGCDVVVMGWPVAPDGPATLPAKASPDRVHYSTHLGDMRRSAERCGVLHAHHGDPSRHDNDFYFRIGTLDGPLDDRLVSRTHGRLRGWLASRPPLFCTIALADLAVAFYRSPELPGESTLTFPLDAAAVDGAFIRDRLR